MSKREPKRPDTIDALSRKAVVLAAVGSAALVISVLAPMAEMFGLLAQLTGP